MYRLIRWYNQNRRRFWSIVIIGALAIGIIQSLNNFYKNNQTEERISNSVGINTITNNKENYAVITKKEINSMVAQNSQNIIEKFFNYCNDNKIEEAYNLLSTSCKEELYPNISNFKDKYVNRIFNEIRSYTCKLWISNQNSNTYKLEISKDMLATGKKDEMPIEEYYTIVYENGKYALNTNGYIEKSKINKSITSDGLTITVIEKQIYMDCEKYLIKIQNNSNTDIILNTRQNMKSIYLLDENKLKYIAFLNEMTNYELNFENGIKKEINIKFNKTYKPNTQITNIVFEDIKMGNQDKRKKITIEL